MDPANLQPEIFQHILSQLPPEEQEKMRAVSYHWDENIKQVAYNQFPLLNRKLNFLEKSFAGDAPKLNHIKRVKEKTALQQDLDWPTMQKKLALLEKTTALCQRSLDLDGLKKLQEVKAFGGAFNLAKAVETLELLADAQEERFNGAQLKKLKTFVSTPHLFNAEIELYHSCAGKGAKAQEQVEARIRNSFSKMVFEYKEKGQIPELSDALNFITDLEWKGILAKSAISGLIETNPKDVLELVLNIEEAEIQDDLLLELAKNIEFINAEDQGLFEEAIGHIQDADQLSRALSALRMRGNSTFSMGERSQSFSLESSDTDDTDSEATRLQSPKFDLSDLTDSDFEPSDVELSPFDDFPLDRPPFESPPPFRQKRDFKRSY
ncbi:MAG: hypothetical protein K0S07_290 [Chlamydiales bacterium]|jgi:hypothetical protein|nr:hypothetical protein [Chlamydiales bacterium]